MENKREDCFTDDEIDLYELWLRLKKRKRVIFNTITFFILLSFIYLVITKPIYRSSFTIRIIPYQNKVYIVTPVEVSKTIQNLDQFIKENRSKELSKQLNINISIASSLKNVEASIVRGYNDLVDIILEVYKTENIPILVNHILLYLNNLYKKRIENLKESLQREIKVLSDNLKELEQEKNKLLSENINDAKGLAEFDRNIINLKEKLILLKTQLKNLKIFEISTYPIIPKKPYKPKKILILAVATISGLFTGIFLALFLEWLEEERKKYKENNIS